MCRQTDVPADVPSAMNELMYRARIIYTGMHVIDAMRSMLHVDRAEFSSVQFSSVQLYHSTSFATYSVPPPQSAATPAETHSKMESKTRSKELDSTKKLRAMALGAS